MACVLSEYAVQVWPTELLPPDPSLADALDVLRDGADGERCGSAAGEADVVDDADAGGAYAAARPTIWLAARQAAEDSELLARLGIKSVVNCAPDHVACLEGADAPVYLCCPLKDGLFAADGNTKLVHDDASVWFEPAATFVRTQLAAGRSVCVHCAGGISRSATVLAAVLLQLSDARLVALRDVLAHLRECRPAIAPNASFLSQLIALERRLRGGAATVKEPLSLHQRGFTLLPRGEETRIAIEACKVDRSDECTAFVLN